MLTWNELKQLVEEKLEESGKDGDIRVSSIDIGLRESISNIVVLIEEDTLQVL
jgi:hypothetical protein